MESTRIRYATSQDGTEIAYAMLGDGPPIILLDGGYPGGLDMRFRSRNAAFYESVIANRTLITLDLRNSGVSGLASDFSLQSYVQDVECVVNNISLVRFDLWTMASQTQVALEFTANHPDYVRKLVITRPQPVGASPNEGNPFIASFAHLASSEWESFVKLWALSQFGWNDGARELAEQMTAQWTPESYQAFITAMAGLDVSHRIPSIRCEALVLAAEGSGEAFLRAARRLAAALPNGRLTILRLSRLRDPEQVPVVNEFLGAFEEAQTGADLGATPTPFRTILFTDIEEHTAMMQRLGDAKGRDLLREHERLTREALRAHGGAEVKTMGDGFMASFGSAQAALECAVALQRAFNERRGEELRIRVGINAGEPIAEDDDLFGSSVILAARTAALAKGGEVLVTDVVRQLVAGKGFVFADRGETALRGFEDPVRLHQLRWEETH